MFKRLLAVTAAAAVMATPACNGDADPTDGDAVIDRDTMIVEGVDTVQQPIEMPTQDTVVREITEDTIGRGEAQVDTPR